jgi:hypothetical protein
MTLSLGVTHIHLTISTVSIILLIFFLSLEFLEVRHDISDGLFIH